MPTVRFYRPILCIASFAIFVMSARGQDKVEAAKTAIVGIWDATPALELEVMRANSSANEVYERGKSFGARVIYKFNRDGTLRITRVTRQGVEDGVSLGRLVPQVVDATWTLAAGDAKSMKLTITPADAKAFDVPLQIQNDNQMTLECYDLTGTPYKTPFEFRRNIGQQAIRWVIANSKDGKDSPPVQDAGKMISQYTNERKDFTIRFGGGLLKSGKPTQIDGYFEQLFITELTEDQAKSIGLEKADMSMLGPPRPTIFPMLCDGKSSELVIDDAEHLNFTKQITGHVKVDSEDYGDPVFEPRQYGYAVHLRLVMGKAMMDQYINLLNAPHDATIPIKFTMPTRHADYAGPLIIFADLCYKVRLSGGDEAVQVVSPAVKLVANVDKPTAK